MYGRFANSKSFCRLSYRRLMFNNIICDLYCSFFNIIFHTKPLHSLFLQCMQRKQGVCAFLMSSVSEQAKCLWLESSSQNGLKPLFQHASSSRSPCREQWGKRVSRSPMPPGSHWARRRFSEPYPNHISSVT